MKTRPNYKVEIDRTEYALYLHKPSNNLIAFDNAVMKYAVHLIKTSEIGSTNLLSEVVGGKVLHYCHASNSYSLRSDEIQFVQIGDVEYVE